MKTIKAIRKTKDVELGELRRVDDKTAHNMVGSSWQYAPKSEWKELTRNTKKEEQEVVATETKTKNGKEHKKKNK